MKKLLAVLVLATSFAAFADDAPKADAPKPTKSSSKKAKKSASPSKSTPAPAAGDSAK
jgi:hypothetical protein